MKRNLISYLIILIFLISNINCFMVSEDKSDNLNSVPLRDGGSNNKSDPKIPLDLKFMSFLHERLLPLNNGSKIRELDCDSNCKISVDRVDCSRITVFNWKCNSSLINSNYKMINTSIDCYGVYTMDENQNPCYFRYSLKTIDNGFDFTILLFILLALIIIFMLIEFLKKFLWYHNCYTPNYDDVNWKSGSNFPPNKLPLRSTFSSLPPDLLIKPLRLDLYQDFNKHRDSKSSFFNDDNYI